MSNEDSSSQASERNRHAFYRITILFSSSHNLELAQNNILFTGSFTVKVLTIVRIGFENVSWQRRYETLSPRELTGSCVWCVFLF